MTKKLRSMLAGLILGAAGVLSCITAGAQQGGTVLNFLDADMDMLIGVVADLTDKRFVVDPRVRSSVTFDAVVLNTPDEAYELLLATLRERGFLALPSGGDIKIVPDPKAQTSQFGAGEPERVIASARPQPVEPRPTRNTLTVRSTQPAPPLVSLQPVTVKGAQRGYRVFPGDDAAAFTRLGLDRGDVVLNINGRALSDPAQGEAIFNAEIKASQVTVTLERGGQVRRLMLSRR